MIELLISMAIIATLMGLLLPALGSARDVAKSAMCLNHLRQFGMAATNYNHIFQDYYPFSYYITFSPRIEHNWDFTTTTDWSTLPATVVVKPGMLWLEESTTTQVHQCPAFDGKSNTKADPYTGYNYNISYIGGYGSEKSYIPPARTFEVAKPSETALFGDGEYQDGANKHMRSPLYNLEPARRVNSTPAPGDRYELRDDDYFRAAGTQGYRHHKQTNVTFCDGSARSHSERHTNTYPAEQVKINEYCGFLSEDNSLYDLK